MRAGNKKVWALRCELPEDCCVQLPVKVVAVAERPCHFPCMTTLPAGKCLLRAAQRTKPELVKPTAGVRIDKGEGKLAYVRICMVDCDWLERLMFFFFSSCEAT